MAINRKAYLVGYKEIASFLGVSERTAQRLTYEGMPINREFGKRRGYVRIEASVLKEWWEKRLIR